MKVPSSIYSKVLPVIAAILVTGCSRNDAGPGPQQVQLTISSGFNATRTHVEFDQGVYTPLWHPVEEIGIFTVTDDGDPTDGSNIRQSNVRFVHSDANGQSGVRAKFTGLINPPASQSLGIYGYYPYQEGIGTVSTLEKVEVSLPQEQQPGARSFDRRADIMTAQPAAATVSSFGEYELEDFRFRRMMAILKLTIADIAAQVDDQPVRSVTLTFGDEGGDVSLTGKFSLDLTGGNGLPVPVAGETTNSVRAVYDEGIASDGTGEVWMIVRPQTIPRGTPYTITVVTEGYTATRSSTLGTDMELLAGTAVNRLAVTSFDRIEAKEKPAVWRKVTSARAEWSGDYLFVYKSGSSCIVLGRYPGNGTYVDGTSTVDGNAITASSDAITESDNPGIGQYAVRLAAGGASGYYTIHGPNILAEGRGAYLYYSSNALGFSESAVNDQGTAGQWKPMEMGGGSYVMLNGAGGNMCLQFDDANRYFTVLRPGVKSAFELYRLE